jgi:hypothetical protein
MANLILKPSTGGVLKIQNDAGTVDALTVSKGGGLTAAGTLGVTGNTTLSGAVTASSTLGVTGNTTLSGTANNLGTITNATTFPSGQIIGGKMLANNAFAGHISTNVHNTMTNSGITGSYTPVKSSDTSWLKVTWHVGMQQNQNDLSETDCTMQVSSSSTSYANANSLGAEGGYNNRIEGTANNTAHNTWVYHVASSPVLAQTPSALTSYVGGTAYYFRLFYKTNGGTFYFTHSGTYWNLWIEEIMI